MNINDNEIYSLMEKLFPICRSITGEGVRQSLNIIKELVPLKIYEVPSGTKVFDWHVPNEWNVNDAYVKNSKGKRIIDFKKSNLHLVGYSTPFKGKINLNDLKKHLYTLPKQPKLIPYITSYYNEKWGFCLSHEDLELLKDDFYEVLVDTKLEPGSMTYGELIIRGQSSKEILLSIYICHPSMVNNELSGPIVASFIAKNILEGKKPYYTYRIVFIPETIGALTYLSRNLDELKKRVVAGYVITCIGDSGHFSYLQSRQENTLVDRVTLHVLKYCTDKYNIYNYHDSRASDERQYCAPGIDLPVGSLTRTRPGEYPEYHTSGDNFDIVNSKNLSESIKMYEKCIQVFENNHTYKTTVLGEPMMGKRGLYPILSKKGKKDQSVYDMMNILAYCDGNNDLLWIANKIDQSFIGLLPSINKLIENGLLQKID